MQGTYLFGIFKGYTESDWASGGKSGVNRRFGIQTGKFEGQWGDTQEQIQSVDVYDDTVAAALANRAPELVGKSVRVRVVFKAKKGGKEGAWLSCFLPRDSDIILNTAKESKAA
ncbi:MAG: hypothetical protein RPT95_13600 [Candidatus Sedimenticola sp. (ex Thyasira tokunagai)]